MTEFFSVDQKTKIVIREASFKDARALQAAIERALKGEDLKDLIDEKSMMASDIKDVDFDFSRLGKLWMSIDSNEAVNEALFRCLSRCTYAGEKITEQTFEPLDCREDFYPVAFACVKENLRPFFKGLVSKFSHLMGTRKQAADDQK